MEIRNAGPADLDAIMDVYHRAREFMRRSGNLTQWADGYPGRELISQEITAGSCYTMWQGRGAHLCPDRRRVARRRPLRSHSPPGLHRGGSRRGRGLLPLVPGAVSYPPE